MDSSPCRGGKGFIIYWDKKMVSWLSFSSLLLFSFICYLYPLFVLFFLHLLFLSPFHSLPLIGFIKCKSHLNATVITAPASVFGSKMGNLVFVLAPFFISLLIYSSLSNILNVSCTWTPWLTTLLYSHDLTILKHAAYMTMPKCPICKCFFNH